MSQRKPKTVDLAGCTPELPGARCRGRWELFDPAGEGESRASVTERHERAVELCGSCPVIDDCRSWIRSEPRRFRMGVVAGYAWGRNNDGEN